MKHLVSLLLAVLLCVSLLGVAQAEQTPVAYLDDSGIQKSCASYTSLTTDQTDLALNTGWYVVDGKITITNRITTSGNVNLILKDGCELTATNGITVETPNSLTIYAQSTNATTMGKLIANKDGLNSGAGIGSTGWSTKVINGMITICGGHIQAWGGLDRWVGSAGIGGGADIDSGLIPGTITIHGGVIEAWGGPHTGDQDIWGAGAGIGARGKSNYIESIIITGGDITAYAGYNGAAGIGGGGHDGTLNNIEISGGVIKAKGTYKFSDPTIDGKNNAIGGGAGEEPFNDSNFSNCLITDLETNQSTVYGTFTLTNNYTIAQDETLTIPQGAKLVIPAGITLTNNGHFIHYGKVEGTYTGNGTVQHVMNSDFKPTKKDDTYHEVYCGCGEPMQEEHFNFSDYRSNHDGTHQRSCPKCEYTQSKAHNYDTNNLNGMFVQECVDCLDHRTISVGSITSTLSYNDKLEPELKMTLPKPQASDSQPITGLSYQWQMKQNDAYTDLSGETDRTYTASNVTSGSLYRVKVMLGGKELYTNEYECPAITDIDGESTQDVTADNVTKEQKADLEQAKLSYEEALKQHPDAFTDGQKAKIQQEMNRIAAALKVLEDVQKAENAITQLPASAETDELDAITAIAAAKEAYEQLNANGKALVDQALVQKLNQLLSMITDYRVVEGDGSAVMASTLQPLTFKANGAIKKFTGIRVDDQPVDKKFYTAVSGSTIITLKPEYLSTLDVGVHKLTVCYTDGEAHAQFVITSAGAAPVPPHTGDVSHPALWAALMALSLCSLWMVQKRRTAVK